MPALASPAPASAGLRASARGALLLLTLLVLLVTPSPFQDLSSARMVEHGTGSEALTYLLLASLGLVGAALLDRGGWQGLLALARPPLVLLAAWLLVSSGLLSSDPSTSIRRLVLTLLTFGLAALAPLLAEGFGRFRDGLLLAAGMVLLLSALGLVLAPELAIHQRTDILEPDLAGAWRGLYSHKNLAGGMMAALALIGLWGMRAGRRRAGALVAAGALVLLLGSSSKSATGLILAAGVAALLVARARSLALRAVIAFTPLLALNLVTVGSAAHPALAALAAALPVDPTFTGRRDIWAFALGEFAEAPWAGHGFQAFWGSARTLFGAEDATSWAGTAATSHNAYLDLALTIGLPGLILALWAFAWTPLRDFHRALDRPGNRDLARLCLGLWLLSLYLGTFEAYILARAEPLWFLLALSVCGLRYAALRPLRP